MKQPTVFDNNGQTCDRFTIITPDGEMFAASCAPFHPQGVGMYAGNIAEDYYRTTVGACFIGRVHREDPKHYRKLIRAAMRDQLAIARGNSEWLGHEVTDLATLPEDVQKHINQIMKP